MPYDAPGHDEETLRWHTRTIVEQLAHVGSEVERTLRARPENRRGSIMRSLARCTFRSHCGG